jgi:hypothetical protein
MSQMREKEAIDAYFKLVQAKGADNATLKKRVLFLEQLSEHLAEKNVTGQDYREAVEALMETIPPEDWHPSLTTAREYFPFWMHDIKAIAAHNRFPGFDIPPNQWRPATTTLKMLTASLETEKFETSETWPIKAYTQALRHEGAELPLVETRVKLAKMMLLRLRGVPERNHKLYRIAVDLTLPLFSNKASRRLFLVVVREFYHFWIGNPDAASKVLQDGSGNILL